MADEKLVDLAVEVFNDELDHWQRIGAPYPGQMYLRRMPLLHEIGPADYIPAEDTGEMHLVPDVFVLDFLKSKAMARVIDEIQKAIAA
ncbi:hypothetical protein [Bradyrhizobium erythrophlei]|uniref:Uncharacterized protein n=1 Tax=Bradyrhizobium erythrophlei TaxID=1437360 RepID=A0A1M5PUP8_9BRAD|nr:hypothetical protein [Bradyrhizobium erythrophlei]SHH05402.1 hypothetical protein SAMN05443248_3514 [Bradyrhizobium erythrophlei]